MKKSRQLTYPPPVADGMKKFYENLDEIYSQVQKNLTAEAISPVDIGYPENPASADKPLLRPGELNLPGEEVEKVMLEITGEFLGFFSEEEKKFSDLEEFRDLLADDDFSAHELLINYLQDEIIPAEQPLEKNLFNQMMLFTIRPFFSWLAREGENSAKITDSWRESFCPICGAIPELARLTGERGERRLWCWVCSTEWQYNRFYCPHCGEEKADGQRYFTVEESAYRVDVCDSCDGYLKVIDEEKVSEKHHDSLSWMINDIGTQHLDRLARQEGYELGEK
ncbi:formate dehydrogenase accessory protein FdhE [Halarsenatibacter silvermanii]|uniref:Formate dehydrogenase formation protein n=1 Tax=Halarsenatibacter silvermanii TaxID=321763 RepID=A0A1G9MXI1_9FIRM|nr:formate dehydrogenase accessory protein FdhE [Halarsenatibacter silvermanii]SDL78814.1 formate dehydrogenase formation protein [Halarsenatibacter silvermanii]